MAKEYVTARLFKNRRAADGMNTQEQQNSNQQKDSNQQQTSESQNNSQQNSQTSGSDKNQNESFLPRRVQRAVQRASELLGLDRTED